MKNLNASIAFDYSLRVGTIIHEEGRVSIDLTQLLLQQKARLIYTPSQSTNLTISIDKDINFNYGYVNFVDKDRYILPLLINYVINTEYVKS